MFGLRLLGCSFANIGSSSMQVTLLCLYIDSSYFTGSPFSVNVLDGTKAVASGEGLGRVLANMPTSFDVTTTAVGGDADLEVEITCEFKFYSEKEHLMCTWLNRERLHK